MKKRDIPICHDAIKLNSLTSSAFPESGASPPVGEVARSARGVDRQTPTRFCFSQRVLEVP